MDVATFAAGCFWGVEHEFRKINGVAEAFCGYSNGHTENPSYPEVCSGRTGHAEVVQVTYDPGVVSYSELVQAFFDMHDPTQLNRQGPDVGDQYRSGIFYHNDQQKEEAMQVKERLDKEGAFPRPIVTRIEPVKTFYKAEEYHQKYFEKNGVQYCH
jgi:peptide-methionine (S)-S-oxide reductase